MDCDICITFERSLRDRESDLAGRVKGCEAVGSQNEMIASLEALKVAVEEFLTERSLFDHHRRRAHAAYDLVWTPRESDNTPG